MAVALKSNEAIASAMYIRMSPRKVRRVLDQVRGRSYREALIILEFMPYRACEPITKVLRSAVANAENNMGPSLKRFRPRAQGRAFQIRKPTCHITITVAPGAEAEEA